MGYISRKMASICARDDITGHCFADERDFVTASPKLASFKPKVSTEDNMFRGKLIVVHVVPDSLYHIPYVIKGTYAYVCIDP